jgi:hypothetical protein
MGEWAFILVNGNSFVKGFRVSFAFSDAARLTARLTMKLIEDIL